MGEGSFDKERISKLGRVFKGTRTQKINGRLSVGGDSLNRHQKEAYKRQQDRRATRGLFDEE